MAATWRQVAKTGAGVTKDKLGTMFNSLKGSAPVAFMKAHPFQSAGLGILGGANVAGLLDNDKMGGQLVGAGLGGAGSLAMHAIGGVTGLPLAWAPLAGGAIGALWDKSRDAKEKEEQQRQQAYQQQMLQAMAMREQQ